MSVSPNHLNSNHSPNPSENSSVEFEISQEAFAISKALTERIKTKIKENGAPIDFEAFMQMALYEPKLGYYQNNLHKFGEKGDFITAPEMGSLFAECIAESIAGSIATSTLGILKNVAGTSILEIGAGSGRLAVDLIKSLKQQNSLPAQYFILEPSATLQSQQKQLFEKEATEFLNRIVWLAELPEQFEGVIIANEVIDAIPCQIIEQTDKGWFYHGVELKGDDLFACITKQVAPSSLPIPLVEQEHHEREHSDSHGLGSHVLDPHVLDSHVLGYQTEIRKQASGWISSLSKCLSKGHILLIDYGYPEREFYHPQRTQGSLTCFINHHKHSDYLKAIGLQDITAHVDFTNIAKAANQYGLIVDGFTTQAGFLLENGIIDKAEALLNSNENNSLDVDRYKISQQIQKLMMPGQMGEVLKVMCLSTPINNHDLNGKNNKTAIKGFSMQDHLHRL